MREALLVLDAQQVYTDQDSELYCEGSDATMSNINDLVKFMSERNQLVILVRHMHKLDGSDTGRLFDFSGEAEDDFNFKENSEEVEFDNSLIRPANAVELIKNRYSAFVGTNLENILKENNIEKVVICGFMTNFCCESAARDALDRDFYVDFVVDATGTPGTEELDQEEVKKVVAELLGAGFARILQTQEFISERSEV